MSRDVETTFRACFTSMNYEACQYLPSEAAEAAIYLRERLTRSFSSALYDAAPGVCRASYCGFSRCGFSFRFVAVLMWFVVWNSIGAHAVGMV